MLKYFDVSVQDCGKSIAEALELPQSCAFIYQIYDWHYTDDVATISLLSQYCFLNVSR